jgi:hypothetical protein
MAQNMIQRSPMVVTVILLHLACVPGLTGCGDSSGPPAAKRYKVSGTVTLDGKSIASGAIRFLDVKGGGDGGEIKNGSYSLLATPGEKRVEISASAPSDKNVEGKESVKDTVSLVPAKYNSKSELKQTVAEKDNNFNFELKSGN